MDYALRVKPGETCGKGASERWEEACDGGCAVCFGQGGEGGYEGAEASGESSDDEAVCADIEAVE